jgi:hypothetical protein
MKTTPLSKGTVDISIGFGFGRNDEWIFFIGAGPPKARPALSLWGYRKLNLLLV